MGVLRVIKKQYRVERHQLGIEFGSTRIKAVLNNEDNIPIAIGSCEWENQLEMEYGRII